MIARKTQFAGLFVLAIAFTSVFFSFAEAQTAPIAAYSFENGAGTVLSNVAGSNFNGTLVNGPTWTTGVYGGALTFDGINDYVSIGDLDLIGSFTVSMWARPTNANTCWSSLVMKRHDYGFEQCNGQLISAVGNGSSWTAEIATGVQAGVWNHYAMTYDGTTLRLYVNGSLVGSDIGTHTSNNNALLIGSWTGSNEFYNGSIDDVRVYDRVLTASEIVTDLNTPLGGTPPPPDTTAPSVSITAPTSGTTTQGTIAVSANASDNVAVVGVQFKLDGANLGAEDTSSPYSVNWDTTTATNGAHTLIAVARDPAGNIATSTVVDVTVANAVVQVPIYRASGTLAAGTGAITPAFPASVAAGDVCLLAVESENQNITLTSAQGFAEVPTWSPRSAGVAATNPASRLALYWKRTIGGDTAPTVADSGDHTTGRIHCFRNVISTGDPWDTGEGGNDSATNDTSGTIPGATTSFANTLVVLFTSTSFNGTSAAQCSAWSNSSLTNLTERADGTNTAGLGGGHCMATGEKAVAGAYSTTTVTLANTSFKGAISLALKSNFSAPDAAAPSQPTNLAATSISQTQINLTWTASSDNVAVAGYQVFRGGVQVATTTAASYNDTGLAPGTNYVYTVSAFDAAGNVSAQSTSANATTQAPDTAPPSQPQNLVAQVISQTRIDLSWASSTDNVAVVGYQVFQNGTQIATTTATTFSSMGLTASTDYLYVVVAFDAAGNLSLPSQSIIATTQAPPAPDTVAPTIAVTSPADGATVSGTVNVAATSSDNIGVVGVQFLLEGAPLGAEDTSAPYEVSWNTGVLPNGDHHISARARDAAGNIATSTEHHINVNNATSSGLVAAYSFNDASGTILSDVSGNNNNGTLINGPTWTTGQYNGALSFDGSNDYVSIGDLDLTGPFTVSMWARPTSASTCWGSLVMKRLDYGFEICNGQLSGGVGNGSNWTSTITAAAQTNVWNNYAITYDGTTLRMYVNGVLAGSGVGSHPSSNNPLLIGAWTPSSEYFAGTMDDVRVYSRALSASELTTDMNTPLQGGGGSSDTELPTVAITSPSSGAQVSNIITVLADASDNVGVVGVQFFVDGIPTGVEDLEAPYGVDWDTRLTSNGSHSLTARARDAAGNTRISTAVTVNVVNSSFFQNEILATGFNLPTNIEFLPDGRLLVGEIAGLVKILPAPYTTPDATPFLDLDINIAGYAGLQQGLFDIALDPNFATNRYFYVFYTNDSPNRDRLSRFTANTALTGTVPGSEVILFEDPQTPNTEHHGGAINFANDGKIYFTTGEHFDGANAQNLTNPRGKIHRINADGTVPTDNPFYDGAGPNWDSIWAYGLRNPFRAYYDAPTDKLYVADVGGNDYATADEEVNVGARGANYGWPNSEGNCSLPCTSPVYSYPHLGRDASITGGFVYHGSAFPAGYQGSYFYADYTQNWIKRITFDANGVVNGTFNFEPANGAADGPYGDIVYLAEGPDGALYYVDLGYSDVGGSFGVSKLRRIRYLSSDLPPTAISSANPSSGPSPLIVNFSSAGSSDPEGQPITYSWTFGDGATSTQANPVHTYAAQGQYTARLTTSDGVNSTLSTPLSISVGSTPTASILTPTNNSLFLAGDMIAYSGDGTDPDDGTLPASAFTWSIDFLHAGHVHPVATVSNVKNGTYVIPTSGHDYSGDTRYRFTLTVTDSSGLQHSTSTIVYPNKVNLTFDTLPSGLTLYLDGIAKQTPLTHDTLINFQHSIEARNVSTATTTYTFASWSDGGTQTHTITVPSATTTYIATYTVSTSTAPITMGETDVFVEDDNGNANLLLAQDATLAQAATIQSLSFYVTTAVGDLVLGLYDATGAGGNPGNLIAQTTAFTPIIGWNTAPVITPVAVPAGNYWLAYLPQDNGLHFVANRSIGQIKYAPVTFGSMPATFPTSVTTQVTHWSLYGTLTP